MREFTTIKTEPSFAEKIFIKKFDALNVCYVREVSFSGCINPLTGASLRYDFYLPLQDILIEYDGVQSHSAIDVRRRDQIKTKFAKDNMIKLYRVQGIENIDVLIRDKLRIKEERLLPKTKPKKHTNKMLEDRDKKSKKIRAKKMENNRRGKI